MGQKKNDCLGELKEFLARVFCLGVLTTFLIK